MTIRFLKPWNGYQPDKVATLSGPLESSLIAATIAVAYVDAGQDVIVKVNTATGAISDPAALTAIGAVPAAPATAISSSVTLTANPSDAGILAGTHILVGKVYACTTALTVSCPDNLPASVTATIIIPPATGNLSLDPTGTATINGAGTTLTRAWAANYGGVSIISRGAGVYGVTGA